VGPAAASEASCQLPHGTDGLVAGAAGTHPAAPLQAVASGAPHAGRLPFQVTDILLKNGYLEDRPREGWERCFDSWRYKQLRLVDKDSRDAVNRWLLELKNLDELWEAPTRWSTGFLRIADSQSPLFLALLQKVGLDNLLKILSSNNGSSAFWSESEVASSNNGSSAFWSESEVAQIVTKLLRVFPQEPIRLVSCIRAEWEPEALRHLVQGGLLAPYIFQEIVAIHERLMTFSSWNAAQQAMRTTKVLGRALLPPRTLATTPPSWLKKLFDTQIVGNNFKIAVIPKEAQGIMYDGTDYDSVKYYSEKVVRNEYKTLSAQGLSEMKCLEILHLQGGVTRVVCAHGWGIKAHRLSTRLRVDPPLPPGSNFP
jgi:hypothetical protein